MANIYKNQRVTGVLNPSVAVNPINIIAKRAPGANDFAEIGTQWIYSIDDTGAGVNEIYVLTSIVEGVPTWTNLESSGGSGSFVNIVASGTILAGGAIGSTTGNITAFSGNIVATLGSVSAGTSVTAGTSVGAGTTITAGGQITSTAGNLVCSAAGQGVILGGGAKVVCGTGDPNTVVTAPQGSLYLNLAGSGVADRLFVNSDSGTTWIAVTTAS